MEVRGRVHEVERGRGGDGKLPPAAKELAGGDAERRRRGLRGRESEVVHGLEDGERFPDGNNPSEMGVDVVVNGVPVWALLSHGDPDGATRWTAMIGSVERGDEVLTIDMGKSSSHGGWREGKVGESELSG